MSGFEIRYGPGSNEPLPGTAPEPEESRRFRPPVTLPPILTATRVRLLVERKRPSRKNPLGSVAGAQWLWPQSVLDARDGTPPVEPPGANALIKVLASAQRGPAAPGRADEPEIIVSYARGYDINASGENVRKPIWQEIVIPPTEEDAGSKKRIQVGHRDPEPVDSIVVAGLWRDAAGKATTFVEGWWVDGSPQRGRIWRRGGHLQQMGWTPFMAQVKAIIEEAPNEEGLW